MRDAALEEKRNADGPPGQPGASGRPGRSGSSRRVDLR